MTAWYTSEARTRLLWRCCKPPGKSMQGFLSGPGHAWLALCMHQFDRWMDFHQYQIESCLGPSQSGSGSLDQRNSSASFLRVCLFARATKRTPSLGGPFCSKSQRHSLSQVRGLRSIRGVSQTLSPKHFPGKTRATCLPVVV